LRDIEWLTGELSAAACSKLKMLVSRAVKEGDGTIGEKRGVAKFGGCGGGGMQMLSEFQETACCSWAWFPRHAEYFPWNVPPPLLLLLLLVV